MNTIHSRIRTAFLAAAMLLPAFGPVEPPQRVSFRLADGVRISGEISAWDESGIDGTFGRRRWIDLHPDDLWTIYRRRMDRTDAGQWVALGGIMLRVPGSDESVRAERAFSEAIKLDASIQPAIEQARREAAEARRKDEEARRAVANERLRTRSPEAGPWSAEPWSPLTDDERAAAVEAVKARAGEILQSVSAGDVAMIETDTFLVFADAPRIEAAQWGWHLNQASRKAAEVLGLERGVNLFEGKAVAFILSDAAKFRLIEVSAFNQLVAEQTQGIVHYAGDQSGLAFVNLHHDESQMEFIDLLAQKAALGLLHRYRSPVRLPSWANEGFAMHVASLVLPGSEADDERRERGREFFRSGGNLAALMDASYSDENWPNAERTVQDVGSLLVWLMIRERPQRFAGWVRAVKDGKDWQEALVKDFGVPRTQLMEIAATYFRVND